MVPIFRPCGLGEGDQVGQPRHGAVVVHHLADHPGRIQAGQARDVDRRLGVARRAPAPRPPSPPAGRRGRAMTMSSGPLVGSMATAMVRARSWAEMPVVTPSFASIETVKAVPCAALVLDRHRRQAQLPRALGGDGQADQAARVLGHEVDLLGRGQLGRDDDVALVLPVLGVDQDVGPPVAGVLDDVLDGRDRARLGCRDCDFALIRSPASAPRSARCRSISRLTCEPGFSRLKVVCVPGVRDQRSRRNGRPPPR